MEPKKINGLKILDENDDFYLTREGTIWALLPKQNKTSPAIGIKPNDSIDHACFLNGLLKLDNRLFKVNFKICQGTLSFEEVVDENADFFLTKTNSKWSLLCKTTNKTTLLSKLMYADKVNFEGNVLIADGKVFYLKINWDGVIQLDEHVSDDSDSSDDNAEDRLDNKNGDKGEIHNEQNPQQIRHEKVTAETKPQNQRGLGIVASRSKGKSGYIIHMH